VKNKVVFLVLLAAFLFSLPTAAYAGGGREYTVREGDSLWEISQRYGQLSTGVGELRAINPDVSSLQAGHSILIPSNWPQVVTIPEITQRSISEILEVCPTRREDETKPILLQGDVAFKTTAHTVQMAREPFGFLGCGERGIQSFPRFKIRAQKNTSIYPMGIVWNGQSMVVNQMVSYGGGESRFHVPGFVSQTYNVEKLPETLSESDKKNWARMGRYEKSSGYFDPATSSFLTWWFIPAIEDEDLLAVYITGLTVRKVEAVPIPQEILPGRPDRGMITNTSSITPWGRIEELKIVQVHQKYGLLPASSSSAWRVAYPYLMGIALQRKNGEIVTISSDNFWSWGHTPDPEDVGRTVYVSPNQSPKAPPEELSIVWELAEEEKSTQR